MEEVIHTHTLEKSKPLFIESANRLGEVSEGGGIL